MSIGYLQYDSFRGTSQTAVEIVKETPKRYQIRTLVRTRFFLGTRPANMVCWVPKAAVTLEPKAGVQVIQGDALPLHSRD